MKNKVSYKYFVIFIKVTLKSIFFFYDEKQLWIINYFWKADNFFFFNLIPVGFSF